MPVNFRKLSTFAANLIVAGTLVHQTPTGSISGSVSDATGAQVVSANIRLINTKIRETKTASTNNTGGYIFSIVAAGEYVLEAESSGFKIERRAGVLINV